MKRIHTVDAVFALILFCAFAVSMLLVLTTGAGAYQEVRDAVENQSSEHMGVAYITMKLRHFDAANVSFGELDGLPALCLHEPYDGIEFITVIYFYDGYVCEIYAVSDEIFDMPPDSGFKIVAARALELEDLGDLIKVRCTGTGGGVAETHIAVGK